MLPAQTPLTVACIEAWNLMGGALDWAAVPVLAELLGVDDVDLLVLGLVQIREAR